MSTERIVVPADAETLAELLAACAAAGFSGKESDEGKTVKELMEIWKCGKTHVSANLRRAQDAGILRTGRRQITRIDGIGHWTPVYSFVFKAKKKATVKRK